MTRALFSAGRCPCRARVLAVFPAGGCGLATMRRSVEIARLDGRRIDALALVAPPPLGAYLLNLGCPTPWTVRGLWEESLAEAAARCREAAAIVPADISIETRVVCERPDRLVRTLAAGGGFGHLVIDAEWCRRRSVRRALGEWAASGHSVAIASAGDAQLSTAGSS
jgi:hypothetical protein